MTQDELKQLLHYDPETGIFTWICRRRGVIPGQVSGSIFRSGYRIIRIAGKGYRAHRLAVLYMTGEWPADEVDHKRGNSDDNRWEKIREATHKENLRNTKIRTDNTSGVKGVFFDKRYRKPWIAEIWVDGKKQYLGQFATLEEAAKVREDASRHLFGEFHREREP